MECPHCYENNRNNDIYCGACGGQMVFICANCRAINEIGRSYCGLCGDELYEEAAPESVPASTAMDQFLESLTGGDAEAHPQRPSMEAARSRAQQQQEIERQRRVSQRARWEREEQKREREARGQEVMNNLGDAARLVFGLIISVVLATIVIVTIWEVVGFLAQHA